jgi:hypothetical protein
MPNGPPDFLPKTHCPWPNGRCKDCPLLWELWDDFSSTISMISEGCLQSDIDEEIQKPICSRPLNGDQAGSSATR